MMSREERIDAGKVLVRAAQDARERTRAEEAARLASIREACAIPDRCGPDTIAAPARGPFVVEPQLTMVPNGVDHRGLDKWVAAPTGYGHRESVRAADVFDRMVASALRRKKPCPVTPGQIAMGRRYAALVERAAADGTKLSRLDASRAGGDSMGWMDRHLEVAQELAILRNRIGAGAAMTLRRIRPSKRGETQRGPIMDRVLVDMVCIKGCTLDEVLSSHGWSIKGDHRKAVTEALCAALDRMIGYRGKKTS
ncbi:hypothetical protein pthi1_p23 [Paracoccus phage vB_PthS_Pthi1]|uniref:Uncharacterized protein n=2 Tax=Paracoccus thiocyanatus TaxID=34006 RepID=A0A1N6SG79_9RHOB|nr:hypothetical protein pthi1_p23 [Paracoccus phage vB_PthS_Pthi1]SIQ40081.1 hypothetical protein SAMN05421641_107100 [Paracoccus thiocyanatus]